jgi:hypothetical protein
MSNATTTLVNTDKPLKQPISFSNNGVKLSSFEDAYRFATCVVKSGFAPKGLDTPEGVVIAIQHGAELGLPPMASLQNIAVINGRPGIYGDAALALVRASKLCQYHREEIIGTEGKDDFGFRIVTKRVDGEEAVDTFTVADAKKAQLWGKTGPWSQYPKRMLRFRARGFSLRDNYGDVLKGLRTVEELQDLPREINVTARKSMADVLGDTGIAKDPEAAKLAKDIACAGAIEYTDAQREQFIAQIESYILDAKISEKALRVELSEARIETEEEFSVTEQPTAVLAQVAAYCTSKAGATTVAEGAR